MPSQAAADLLTRFQGERFPHGSGRWRCIPVAEFHETNDRPLWQGADEGWELWKGESFDQYDPHGTESRPCPPGERALRKAHKPRPGSGSLLASKVPVAERAAAVSAEVGRARLAFRDVSRATDSRTIRAALVPPETFLTNKAPYVAFLDGGEQARACCLALLNSLPFDWQARRFVETNINFFILELLRLPGLSDESYEALAAAAAALSCPDERFADFAAAAGVEVGPLPSEERDRLRAEIDARVAHAWDLEASDLETIFADFTLDAVPETYRRRVRDRFAELAAS